MLKPSLLVAAAIATTAVAVDAAPPKKKAAPSPAAPVPLVRWGDAHLLCMQQGVNMPVTITNPTHDWLQGHLTIKGQPDVTRFYRVEPATSDGPTEATIQLTSAHGFRDCDALADFSVEGDGGAFVAGPSSAAGHATLTYKPHEARYSWHIARHPGVVEIDLVSGSAKCGGKGHFGVKLRNDTGTKVAGVTIKVMWQGFEGQRDVSVPTNGIEVSFDADDTLDCAQKMPTMYYRVDYPNAHDERNLKPYDVVFTH